MTNKQFIAIGAGLVLVGAAAVFRSVEPVPPAGTDTLDAPTAQAGESVRIVPPMAYTFTKLKASTNSSLANMGMLVQGRAPVDDPGLRLAWYVNDSLAGLGGELAADSYVSGDEIELRLERQTATDVEVLDVARQTILNSVPVLRHVVLRQAPDDANVIEAIVDGSDADEDEWTAQFEWSRNGKPDSSVKGSRYPLAKLESGDEVIVRATMSDHQGQSEPLTSKPFRLTNRNPSLQVASSVNLDRGTDQTTASLAIEVTDPDGDTVNVELVGAPSGVRWDAASQSVRWPVREDLASFTAKLVATDARGGRVERDIRLGTTPAGNDDER